MKHHFYGPHLEVHADFSALTARESEVEARWRGEEAAVAGLPRPTTFPGSHWVQESCNVCNGQVEWGAERRQQHHMGAGAGEIRSPEDQTQGKGHLAEITNSLISLRASRLDSLWAGVVPLVLEFCITYHVTSHCCTMLVHRYSINVC